MPTAEQNLQAMREMREADENAYKLAATIVSLIRTKLSALDKERSLLVNLLEQITGRRE